MFDLPVATDLRSGFLSTRRCKIDFRGASKLHSWTREMKKSPNLVITTDSRFDPLISNNIQWHQGMYKEGLVNCKSLFWNWQLSLTEVKNEEQLGTTSKKPTSRNYDLFAIAGFFPSKVLLFSKGSGHVFCFVYWFYIILKAVVVLNKNLTKWTKPTWDLPEQTTVQCTTVNMWLVPIVVWKSTDRPYRKSLFSLMAFLYI